MSLINLLTKAQCEQLLLETYEGKIFSAYSTQGSIACTLTKSGKKYHAGHMTFPSGKTIHAEIGALIIAYQTNPKDPIIATAIISTKTEDKIQYPCGSCLQTYADYIEIMSKNKIITLDHEIIFICGKKDLEYEQYTLNNLLPHMWKTKG